jgi:hypothetical protein
VSRANRKSRRAVPLDKLFPTRDIRTGKRIFVQPIGLMALWHAPAARGTMADVDGAIARERRAVSEAAERRSRPWRAPRGDL